LALVRRIIIVLVGISLAILVTVLLLNPESISTLALQLTLTSGLIRLPLAILIDVVILAVLAVLVRGERAPQHEGGLIVKAQGAIADISVDSARDRMLRAVREVPGVISAESTVKALRGKADVDMDVVVSRESSNLPEKQKEIDRALRQVLNKQLGLQMAGKPRVHIRMDGESALTPPAELPAPAPVVAAVEPAKPEPIVVTEVKEAAAPISVQDTMSLRPDSETKSDTSTSN
jgi:hypothetical protein